MKRAQVNQVSEMDPKGNVSHLWMLHVAQLVITVETNHKSMLSRNKYGLLIEIRKIIRLENINIHVLVYVTGLLNSGYS